MSLFTGPLGVENVVNEGFGFLSKAFKREREREFALLFSLSASPPPATTTTKKKKLFTGLIVF